LAHDAAASTEQAWLAQVSRVFDNAIKRMTRYKEELRMLLSDD
jgi:hypothetical protein